MSKKLIMADVDMCPHCEAAVGKPDGIGWFTCPECNHGTYEPAVGYYAPDTEEIAANLRRFAGDRDWEFEDGEPADLRGWADSIEAAPDIDGVIKKLRTAAEPDHGNCGDSVRVGRWWLLRLADTLKGTK